MPPKGSKKKKAKTVASAQPAAAAAVAGPLAGLPSIASFFSKNTPAKAKPEGEGGAALTAPGTPASPATLGSADIRSLAGHRDGASPSGKKATSSSTDGVIDSEGEGEGASSDVDMVPAPRHAGKGKAAAARAAKKAAVLRTEDGKAVYFDLSSEKETKEKDAAGVQPVPYAVALAAAGEDAEGKGDVVMCDAEGAAVLVAEASSPSPATPDTAASSAAATDKSASPADKGASPGKRGREEDVEDTDVEIANIDSNG
ncbi:unnamed protein product, partial [Phaeothamnion confervicola]